MYQILQQYIMEFGQKHLLLLYLPHSQLKVQSYQKNQMKRHSAKEFVFHVCSLNLKSLIILVEILEIKHQLNYEIKLVTQTSSEFFNN